MMTRNDDRLKSMKQSTLLANDLQAEMAAQARSEEEARRDELRAMEIKAARVEHKPLFLTKFEIPQYERLEQNLVGRSKIPEGVDDKNRYNNILCDTIQTLFFLFFFHFVVLARDGREEG